MKAIVVKKYRKPRNYWLEFLCEFQRSANPSMDVILSPYDCYVNARSLQKTILTRAKAYNISGIHTKCFSDRVYLFKED